MKVRKREKKSFKNDVAVRTSTVGSRCQFEFYTRNWSLNHLMDGHDKFHLLLDRLNTIVRLSELETMKCRRSAL